MILSQLFRGFTKQIKYLDRLTTRDVAAGFKKAVDTAYKAVMKPKEGTIDLTGPVLPSLCLQMLSPVP